MTVEERKQLCEALRGKRSWSGALAKLMPDAADEIERLAKDPEEWEQDYIAEIQRLRVELAKAQRLCGEMLQKQHALECDAELWRRRND